MSVEVSGTITSPAENRDHEGPIAVKAGDFASGSTQGVHVGKYVNRGNVDQTLTISLTNLVNCEEVSLSLLDDESAEHAGVVTLAPGAGAQLTATVKMADEAIGSDSTPFSFEVDDIWS